MQISSTQVHKNRSALLFPPPLSSPASELLLLVPTSFLVSSLPFTPHHPPPHPSPSFVLLPFPSHVSSLPFNIFLPPSGPAFLTRLWMDRGYRPLPQLAVRNYNGLTLFQEIPKSFGSLSACVEGMGVEGRPQVWCHAVGSASPLPGFKSQLCLWVV